ncbi:MAG: hypothetical protein ACI89D_000969, partial [Bermanella sp.]
MKRRQMLRALGLYSGTAALNLSVMGSSVFASSSAAPEYPIFTGLHFVPRAKRVIFIWQQGGMSPYESFENKAIL